MRTELVADALKNAAATTPISPDRFGIQTTAGRVNSGPKSVRWTCDPRWAEPGCVGINAAAESFFAALKNERVYRTVCATKTQAKRDVISYIQGGCWLDVRSTQTWTLCVLGHLRCNDHPVAIPRFLEPIADYGFALAAGIPSYPLGIDVRGIHEVSPCAAYAERTAFEVRSSALQPKTFPPRHRGLTAMSVFGRFMRCFIADYLGFGGRWHFHTPQKVAITQLT
jgi:hypothetical protein